MENQISKKRRTSIKRKVFFFSILLFSLIFFIGIGVFVFFMSQTVRDTTGYELAQALQIERIKLEASVNGEIALAMKMATSPLIIRHFNDPADQYLKRNAFDEIEGYRAAFASNIVFWASDVDKEFYFSEDSHYTLDVEDPDTYWYKMTLYETERYNFNINYNAEADQTNLWINAPVFGARRTPIGLVGSGIILTDFVESIYKSYTGSAALYLFNEEGEITGAKDSKLVADKVTMQNELGERGAEIFSKAVSLKTDEFINYEIPGGVIAIGRVPALGWYIAAIQPVGVIDILGSNMTFLFLLLMAVIALIFFAFYVYISRMLKPMNYMVETLDHISVDWDLTQKLVLKRRDEIGTLGEFFNLTFGKIRDLLVGIKGKTIALSDTGDELASYMSKTRKDIEGINNNIQGMRTQVLSQSDKVNAAASSMDHIIAGLYELNDHITIQAENVSQSSSAIEQMLANIQSVTQTLVRNTANIHSLAESSEAGRIDVQKVSADIHEIALESESLLEINSVMQTIASQTNLLSMNAAIEAAHAGESGKGFAVVADEIRKLAENSGQQSKTISAVLKKIKSMIDTITKSTGVVLERFENIESEVKTVSDQESQIRNAMEEQGAGSRQILEAVTQLNSVTGLVRKASADMSGESKQVLQQSTDLKKITTEVAGSMDEMTQSAEEISKTITRVQEITQENKENIVALSGDISRFKVD
ncbi:MAG: methyl-accepting chemotaxis protein [Treponema sp.]|nr:methyl-accepting chemotaxis protein [Treponema sp.]